ncbi:class I SAM-dependent methyltransferase [Actinoplanes flavus]|uniref:Class I SAM-dependent methyltransferase n=1 Tax=Actinoplanes flavus TaxID=2820290 RepID=A0ABS3UX84_9ACTN|nr:class I SAM-dependent methyltransferase [Actinoplanes flavus]MBO3743174.1 class I SAM-dependent methyltransferase [Actinoplanes flavus]
MLLDDQALHASSVVANNAMNRERQLSGVNSYAKVLGFDPVELLAGTKRSWLDLCCGSGRALIRAAARLDTATLVGVDLVDAFAPGDGPELIAAPVETWTPDRTFDLITCVHGLHYVGDKLGVLQRVLTWLNPSGRFVAGLDLTSVRTSNGRPAGRRLTTLLRKAGIEYDALRHRISCTGPRELALPYAYLGADDHAGPNYTGQPAVHSHYG